ncbi:hypothetical protein FRC15_010538 [Serendipita sp. 397]|nr:hypothetical protein FRC15_010538 [Serendipita sp. 397]
MIVDSKRGREALDVGSHHNKPAKPIRPERDQNWIANGGMAREEDVEKYKENENPNCKRTYVFAKPEMGTSGVGAAVVDYRIFRERKSAGMPKQKTRKKTAV